MNIKEIALRLLAEEFPGMRQENQAFMVEFAEALIESYKAELLKEVGEPVAVTNHAQLGYVTDGMHPDIPLAMWAKETGYSGANIALYTSDQVAAAILKATKPREEEVEFQRTAHNRAMEMMLEQGAQLAAAQAYAEQLQAALQTFIDEHEECTDADDWMAMLCSIEAHHVAEEALALPHDTSALDAYVAKRLHDMACDKGLLRIQVEELTRHRDLAVEALETYGRHHPDCHCNTLVNPCDCGLSEALSAIKESKNNQAS